MIFQESKIDWHFDELFRNLIQLDNHTHSKTVQSNTKARKQGERDLKTVDLIGTFNDEETYFIEIKNYLGANTDNSLIDELIHELILKVKDSFSLILSGSRAADNDRKFFKRLSVLLKEEARFIICFWIENMIYKNKQQTELKLRMIQQKLKSILYSWTESRVIITNSEQDWQKILPNLAIKVH